MSKTSKRAPVTSMKAITGWMVVWTLVHQPTQQYFSRVIYESARKARQAAQEFRDMFPECVPMRVVKVEVSEVRRG